MSTSQPSRLLDSVGLGAWDSDCVRVTISGCHCCSCSLRGQWLGGPQGNLWPGLKSYRVPLSGHGYGLESLLDSRWGPLQNTIIWFTTLKFIEIPLGLKLECRGTIICGPGPSLIHFGDSRSAESAVSLSQGGPAWVHYRDSWLRPGRPMPGAPPPVHHYETLHRWDFNLKTWSSLALWV